MRFHAFSVYRPPSGSRPERPPSHATVFPRVLVAFLVVSSAALCDARQDSAAPPPGSSPDGAVLAGPRVEAAPARKSILSRDFDGRVRLAEPTPEEAALVLLSLSDEERQATQQILERRARLLDDLIARNLTLLQRLDTEGQSAPPARRAALLLELVGKLGPLFEGGSLEQQLARTLTPDHARRFSAMLREYWDALAAERMRVRKPDGTLPGRLEALLAVRGEALGRQAERSFQRITESGELIFRIIFRDVELRPEQASRIREILALFAAHTKGAPTEQQNGQLFLSIAPLLDETQLRKVLENVKGL